ncbi:RHS repeat domain-containing protein [Flavivirga sp. 57AJ16]|uniref:RHS repeat domain-containing protein n=1 Tax=Flavivirga sp. 57AJ16 TaxID=3025307 RepID=UPI00236583C1|nr:RHS repeat domain-containing protein [Flavivirga sp. 57AJ16]MDD7884636.1 RHS repeat protein [Flavivirga sp. 57AJ16]
MSTRLLSLFFFLFCFSALVAQNLPSYAPVSPNAASLGKFGSFPVNTNLGTTNISVPLYTIKQGDIEIPISLSYNAASGIRVNEEASWVGLGWTLNAGGAIVRSVKGQPGTSDIPDLGSLDFNQANYNYMYDVARGWADTAQDEYLFNYSGVSGKFYYDQNKSDFVFTDYKPIKIITGTNVYQDDTPIGFGGYSFIAILENGLQLDFGAQETMDKWANTQLPVHYRKYKSTSYLTKVTSANQTDHVTFDYDNYLLNLGKEIMADVSTVSTGTQSSVPLPTPIISDAYKLNTKILKQINFKNGYVLFDYSLDRVDSYSPKLNHIKVYSLINGTASLIKQITFNYGYYNRSGGKTYSGYIPYVTDHHNKSLKLNSVDIFSNNVAPQTYTFDYDNTALPIKNSSGQDFWGYANNNNGSYIHEREASFYTATQNGTWSWDISVGSFSDTVGTGDREANEQKSKAGILTKITYPTGGYTMLEYEANKYETTISVPTYTGHSRSIISEGTGGFGTCDTGLKTLTFSPATKPYNEKLKITFTDALGGNGNQSYGEFDGQKYFRDPPTTLYPYTTHDVDLTLHQNTNYTIEAMEYGDGAPGASGCPFVQVRVTWDELTGTTSQIVEELVGGLRIKSITNYDGVNANFTSRKEFEYSTPQVLIPIINGDYQTLKSNGNGGYINTVSSSPGYALNINGGPSIEYLTVVEYDMDHNNKDSGKTVYEYKSTYSDRIIGDGSPGTGPLFDVFVHPSFHGGSCLGQTVPATIPYFEMIRIHGYGNFSNYYTKSWTSGSLKKQEFYKRNSDNTYTKLRSLENNYTLVDEASLHINYVNDIFPWTNHQVSSSDFNNACNFANYTFMYNKGFYSFGKKLLSSSIETQYDENGTNPIVTEKTFSYNNPSYFLTEQTLKDSKNDIIRTETLYPEDVVSPSVPIQKLLDQHRISEPIEVKIFKKTGVNPEQQLSSQVTQYKEWYTDKVFPEFIKTLKGDYHATNNPLVNRIEFVKYDDLGHVLEVKKSDGMAIVYLWGYGEEYPVAKIENATHAAVTATLTSAELAGVKAGTYNQSTMISTLNKIRTGLPNAMVTTYTYDPLIGVTSTTDPKGYTVFYEYDDFNRLEFVRDADGNLLSENKYNYKN